MKAISILQPWASLVAVGAKKIETRSWPTKYRGPLAIHASKPFPDAICLMEPFKSALTLAPDKLPRGAVIATCNLVDVYEIGDGMIFKRTPSGMVDFGSRTWPSTDELAFGDYTPGRYAWILEDVRQIGPVPAKGRLRLWKWTPPAKPT